MNELLKISILSLVLTLGAYRLAVWLRQKTKLSFLSPVVVGAMLVLPVLWAIKLPQKDYQQGMELAKKLMRTLKLKFEAKHSSMFLALV